MAQGAERWHAWRAAGLRGRRRVDLPVETVLEAVARHRDNAARGREACEQWGPGSSVSRVRIPRQVGEPLDLAVKWNHPRGLRRGIAERLRGSRADRAERGARALARAGVDHPATLAVAEARGPGRVRESFLVSEFLADAAPLPAVAPELRGDFRRRRAVVRALGATLARLHAAGLDHRDLKHSNLLLREGDRFALLDLDSLVPPRAPGLRQRARALGQLEAYARDLYPWLPASDRPRLLAAYLAGSPGWQPRARELGESAMRWADRRIAEWSRKDRRGHHRYPLGPRDAGAPGS